MILICRWDMQQDFCFYKLQHVYNTIQRGNSSKALGFYVSQPDSKPRQIALNHNYNMTISFSSCECYYSPLQIRISCSNREPFRMLLPLLRHVVPLNDGNFRLTCPSLRDATIVMRYLTPWISARLNPLKIILPQYNMFTTNLRT